MSIIIAPSACVLNAGNARSEWKFRFLKDEQNTILATLLTTISNKKLFMPNLHSDFIKSVLKLNCQITNFLIDLDYN